MPEAEALCDEVAGEAKRPKKQLQLTKQLKIFIANLLTPLIDAEIEGEDHIMLNVLQKKGTHGRRDGIEQILRRIAESDDPTVKDKTTTSNTLTKWIDEFVQMGREENERLASDAGYGRNSSHEVIPQEVEAWAYVMKKYDELKINQEKAAVKITRYNRVPDHLQGTGVALIKCDSAFLPGSGAAGKDQKRSLC